MRKLDLDKHWLEILIAASGVLMLAVSFLTDAMGLGGQAGFGGKQMVLAVLGSGLLLAAGVMLGARRRGWDPKIPTVAELKAYAHRQWRDILLVVILAGVGGFASYQGAQLIDPVMIDETPIESGTGSTWFESDIPEVFHTVSNRWSADHYRSSIHPLFALATYPPVDVLGTMLGIEPVGVVRMVVAAVASFWISTLFILLRFIDCRRFDAILFSVLAMTSASAMFWLVVPETSPLGSLSILLALGVVALAQHRELSPLWYTVVSALSLSFTITNWMAGIIATIVKHSWKQSLQITVNAFCLVVVLSGVGKYIFPQAEFFLFVPPDRADFILTPMSGGPLHVIKSFVFHTMVMPTFQLVDRFNRPNWPIMITQFSSPGSGSLWGTVAVGLWAALLGLGLWALFSIKQHRQLRIALGLTLLGQLTLHILYGEEIFLYSLHFAPLLVLLAALSTLTRARLAALVLAGALVLSVGMNNGLQFIKATEVIQCLKLNDLQTTEMSILPQSSDSLHDSSPFAKPSSLEEFLDTCVTLPEYVHPSEVLLGVRREDNSDAQ